MKTVHYYRTLGNPMVGSRAIVWPVDHPDCSNTSWALTSAVKEITPEGFNTENTRYVQVVEIQPEATA